MVTRLHKHDPTSGAYKTLREVHACLTVMLEATGGNEKIDGDYIRNVLGIRHTLDIVYRGKGAKFR